MKTSHDIDTTAKKPVAKSKKLDDFDKGVVRRTIYYKHQKSGGCDYVQIVSSPERETYCHWCWFCI